MSQLELKDLPSSHWSEFARMASSHEAYLAGVYEEDELLNSGWIANTKTRGTLGLFLNEQLIGYSQYGVNAQNVGWFSLFIDPLHRGNGYSKMAVSNLNQYMFEALKITAIRHTAFLVNSQMITVLKNLGAVEVGVLRMGGTSVIKSTGQKIVKPCVVLEFNTQDYQTNKSKANPDPQKSYGIDNRDFLQTEKYRLGVQGSIEASIGESLDRILSQAPNTLRILDFGCGVGNLSYNLAKKYKNHSFCGVDIEAEFISEANSKLATNPLSNICFICSDASNTGDLLAESDIFIFRLVAQHLGADGLKTALRNILAARGERKTHFIISDIDDRTWLFEPENSALRLALASAQYSQAIYGGDRFIGSKLTSIASDLDLQTQSFLATSFNSHNLGQENFDTILKPLLYQKIDRGFINAAAVNDVKSEVSKWLSLEKRFAMASMFTVHLCN